MTTHEARPTSSPRLRRALIFTLLLATSAAGARAQDKGALPLGQAPGAPAGSYALSDFESVNLFNGSLNFRLPLISVGGRGGARHTVPFVQERKWVMRSYFDPSMGRNVYYESDDWVNGLSPGFSPGVVQGHTARFYDPEGCDTIQGLRTHPQTLSYLTFTAPDGTQYNLYSTHGRINHLPCSQAAVSRGRVFASADGSAATFVAEADVTDSPQDNYPTEFTVSGNLLLRDGTRYRVVDGLVRQVRDQLGNLLSVDYGPSGVNQITDSLRRVVTFGYGVQDGQYGTHTRIVFAGVGGEPRVIRLSTTNLEAALAAGHAPRPGYDPQVVSSVWLPDGARRYRLFYNGRAELVRVELPTGGAIEYTHEGGLEGGDPDGIFEGVFDGVGGNYVHIYRRVTERRVYPDGVNLASRMTIGKPEAAPGGRSIGYVETKQYGREPGGAEVLLSSERHYFHGGARPTIEQSPFSDPPTGAELTGREHTTEVYDAGGALLRKVENAWQPGGAQVEGAHVTQTLTTLADAGLVAKTGYGYDAFQNRTDVWEYDFGAGSAPAHPSRHAHTDYLTINAANGIDYTSHTGAHVRGLPRASQVYSVDPQTGAETLAAKSETLYDESAYAPITYDGVTVPGWAEPVTAARGLATTSRRWLDTDNTWLETHAQYDQLGNVRNVWDAKGNLSQVEYDDRFSDGNNARNTYAYPTRTVSPVPDPTGRYGSTSALVTSTVYDFHTGLACSATDVNNQTTLFSYEDQPGQLDRLKAVVRPDGGRTDFEYGDAVGNLYVRTLSDLDGARRTEARQYFDGLGRTYRRATYENSVQALPWLHADTEYDALGRVARASMPYRSAGGGTPLTQAGWSNVKRSETAYDALGRVLKVTTRPDGAAVRTTYAGDRVLVTDQANKQRISRTDALGRLKEVWEVTPNDAAAYPGVQTVSFPVPAGVPAPAAGYRTDYYYDALGNLRRAQQGAQARFFAYDSLSRLLRAKNPEQGAFTPDETGGDFTALADSSSGVSNGQWSLGYVYDENGNLAKRRDARGTTTSYGYDALNRSVTVTYALGGQTAATADVRRHYDNPADGANGKGRLWKSEAVQTALTTVDKYDEAGRPKEQTQKFWVGTDWGPQAYTTNLTYNLAGGVTSQEYPSTRRVEYEYDAAGRLGDNGQRPAFKGTLGDGVGRTYASQVLYDEAGGMSQEMFGTQTPVFNKRFYNVRGQLGEIRVSTHPITSTDFSLKTNWNRGAIINHYSQAVWGGSDQYNNGNLRTQQVWIPVDDSISGWSLFEQTYTYDALNQLRGVTEGGRWRQEYDYDRWGNRTINAAATQVYEQDAAYSIPEPQFTVDQSTNRLGVPTGQAGRMDYDAAGNLVNDSYSPLSFGSLTEQQTRFYDAEGRMTSAQTNASQAAAYAYDADGRRVRRMAGTPGEVWQVYGVGGELLAEYAKDAPSSQPQKEYGYRAGELLVTAEVTGGWGEPPVLSDNPLVAGQTVVRSLHVTELRNAINALRAHKGMAAFRWQTDAASGDWITAAPVVEMRAALDGALGAPSGGYSAGAASGQPIKAVHIQELRERVLGAWQGGSGVGIRWLVADQLGTPRMVIDKTGSLATVARHDYFPFGEEIQAGVGGRTTTQGYSQIDNVRQRFTKKERDAETGLDFFEARYYSSNMGRFTSPDEFTGGPDELYSFVDDASDNPTVYADLTNPQSLNKYQYAYNNPLRYVDPDGHAGQEPDVIIPLPPVPQCYLCSMKQQQEQLVVWRNVVRQIEEHNKRVRERQEARERDALVPPPQMDPCLSGSSCPPPPEPRLQPRPIDDPDTQGHKTNKRHHDRHTRVRPGKKQPPNYMPHRKPPKKPKPPPASPKPKPEPKPEIGPDGKPVNPQNPPRR